MAVEGCYIYLRGVVAEEGAWRREPCLGGRQADGPSISRAFNCFLGSGGWAFKQHVVPCVNPIL